MKKAIPIIVVVLLAIVFISFVVTSLTQKSEAQKTAESLSRIKINVDKDQLEKNKQQIQNLRNGY